MYILADIKKIDIKIYIGTKTTLDLFLKPPLRGIFCNASFFYVPIFFFL